MPHRFGIRPALVCALALVAALAAAAPAWLPARAETLRPLTFALANNLFNAPVFTAVENGLWVKRGLDVKLKLVTSGREIAEAMQTGEAQLGGVAFSTSMASARASGNRIKGVMPYYNAAGYIARGGGRGVVGRVDRGVVAGSPASLAGKKIAYTAGSTQDVLIRQILSRAGVDLGRVQLVTMPVPDMPIAMTQGLVDAAAPWEPYLARIIRELGADAAIVSRAEPGLLADAIGVAAREDYVAANQDLLMDFATGLAEAAQLVRRNPAEAAKIATYYLEGMIEADAVDAFATMDWDPRVSVCTEIGVVRSGNDMVRQGLIKAERPFVAEDLLARGIADAVLAGHPEFFADLPALPRTASECQGALP